MRSDSSSNDRPAFPVGHAVVLLLVAVLLFLVATRLEIEQKALKVGIVGLLGFVLLRALLWFMADLIGEVSIVELSSRYSWFRPLFYVILFVGIVLYALWSSGSL